MRTFLALILGAFIAAAQVAPAAAQCAAAIDSKLREIGVDAARVKSISVSRDGTQEGHIQGYVAWVKLNDCRGSVVMDMTTYCLVSSVYTRGSCRISGVSAY